MSFRSLCLGLCVCGLIVVAAPGCHDKDHKKDENVKPMGTKSLYDRLGGEPAIKVVVHDFVARAASDPKVNFFRKGVEGAKEWKPGPGDVDKLEAHLVALVGQLTGGPQVYKGKAMKPLHAGMKIKSSEFDAAAADLVAALDAAGVKRADRDELIGIVATTKKDIVEVP
jgi:hemoglobin